MYLIASCWILLVIPVRYSQGGDLRACHPGWEQVNLYCYKLASSELATWSEAEKLCQASNSGLYSVDTAADDLIMKTLRSKIKGREMLIWAKHNPLNRNVPSLEGRLNNVTCFGIDVVTGQHELGKCQDYRPYMCETWLNEGNQKLDWFVGSLEDSRKQAETSVLKISGGILAGVIVCLFTTIAIAIAAIVYIRRRRTAPIIRQIYDELPPGTKDDTEVTLEPLQATEVLEEGQNARK